MILIAFIFLKEIHTNAETYQQFSWNIHSRDALEHSDTDEISL